MGIGKILLVLGAVGSFIFLAACAGGNYWIVTEYSSDYGSGLWKACIPKCVSFSDENIADWFKAVRAFAVISCLAAAAGILMSILGLVSETIKGVFASLCLFGAAGSMALALIIYSSKTTLIGTKYGWSYILGWIGAIGSIAAAVIGIMAERF